MSPYLFYEESPRSESTMQGAQETTKKKRKRNHNILRIELSKLGAEAPCGHGLPDDLIASDILTRLPVKSLLRFKVICKSWHAMISNPTFVDLHLDRSKRSPQILMATSVYGPMIRLYTYGGEGCRTARYLLGMQFPELQPSWLFPLHHCNGLVLIMTHTNLLLCNPSTKELVTLPTGNTSTIIWEGSTYYGSGLSYVSSIEAYKVVRYFYRTCVSYEYGSSCRPCGLGFQVLTLGVDSSWKTPAQHPPYPISGCPVSVGETIYFKVCNRLHSSSPKAFLAFNLREEEFEVVDPPYENMVTDNDNMHIVGLEGKPCLVHRCQDGRIYDMWISEDCNNHRWIPTCRINLRRPSKSCLPVASRGGKLLLSVIDDFFKLGFYDSRANKLESLLHIAEDIAFYHPDICGLHFYPAGASFRLTNFAESLVSITPKG